MEFVRLLARQRGGGGTKEERRGGRRLETLQRLSLLEVKLRNKKFPNVEKHKVESSS